MISYEEALAIAREFISKQSEERNIALAIFEDRVKEKPYGWVFRYQSARFVKDADINSLYGIFGTPPFIVDKESGKIRFFESRPQIDFPYEGEVDFHDAQIAYEDQLWEQKSKSTEDTTNSIFVSDRFLYSLLDPIMRYVDAEDEYPELNFHGLNGNNPVEVKDRVIRPFIVPWFHKWWGETSQQIIKNSFQYYLNQDHPVVHPDNPFHRQDLFDRVIAASNVSFDPPTPPRLFFVWIWDELFGPENYHIDTRHFVVDDDREWHLISLPDPDGEHRYGKSA